MTIFLKKMTAFKKNTVVFKAKHDDVFKKRRDISDVG
jgi:hypothetical protein